MIELRKLRLEDAPFMLEWMHDDDLIKDMRADFKSKTLEDCRLFIRASQEDKKNAHFAVADIADTYVGTVSLKNIDIENKAAEFAICMRRCALGTGMAAEAMKKVIEKAFQEMKLEIVYWSVNPGSKRAVRFYNKNGYLKIRTLNEHFKQIIFRGGGTTPLFWKIIGGMQKSVPIVRGELWKKTEYRWKISPDAVCIRCA